MKRLILTLTALLVPLFAFADDVTELAGRGINPEAANYIATGMEDGVFSDDVTVGDDLAVTGLATVGETLAVTGVLTASAGINMGTSQTLDGTTSILIDIGGTTDLTIADNTITIADGTALKVGNSIGWTAVTGADTACSTTCGISDCIIGNDGTNFVTCADATADSCLCDGAAS